MPDQLNERQLLRQAQSNLDRWTNSARRTAYEELFEGEEAILTTEEIRILDALDSALERDGGDGIWGTDQYGVHTGDDGGSAGSLRVICVYHPQVTDDSVLRDGTGIDDETEERLNDALWKYSRRVATLIESDLRQFVREPQE